MSINKRLIALIVIVFITGCAGKETVIKQIPKLVVAADVRTDTVKGLTPEIEQALLKIYLSDKKILRSSYDFKKVVNSHTISGGTVYLVRTKGGYFTYFVQEPDNNVLFVSGSEYETITVGAIDMSTIRDKDNDLAKIFIGTFNFLEATQVSIIWKDGHQTTHQLTNGTLLTEVRDNEKIMNSWDVLDISGKSLYKQQVYN